MEQVFRNLFAHSPREADGAYHGLEDHLRAVAGTAAAFARSFGAESIAWLLGMAHDAGKADPRFQAYLRAAVRGDKAQRCPHSAAGARAASAALGPFALAVLGHHAGMPDRDQAKGLLERAHPETARQATALLRSLAVDPARRPELPEWARLPMDLEMLIRMAFSCLVDADFSDTETHFRGGAFDARGSYEPLCSYKARLDAWLDRLAGEAPEGLVNTHRKQILAACRAAAAQRRGFFDLQAPTGGGKTLSGLAFALDHATLHGLERVIVAIPYTSIIDQTASAYERVFGKGAILEHHSAVDVTDDDSAGALEVRRKLGAENWDCPLIVTTTVQLFESLLSNRPSRCRKLHRIAGSVLVLDEVQALPPACLGPVLDVLGQLVRNYRCSVVLSTATLPDLGAVDPRVTVDRVAIVPEFTHHYEALRRVRYEVRQEAISSDQVAEEVRAQEQVLVVLNSRRDALRIARLCQDAPGLAHLSSLMCAQHRRRVLAEVRARLGEGEPVRLISTQVVEAGVDLDFPVVMRAMGPLDRIVQVAGRCNREGRRETGRCVVFELADGRAPVGAYMTATAVTRTLIAEAEGPIDGPDAVDRYTREAFALTETGSDRKAGDLAEVQRLRERLAFAAVAATFRLIDDDTEPVIVQSYDPEVARLLGAWEADPRGWFRRIAPYTVSIRRGQARGLRDRGMLLAHESGAGVYAGQYDPLFGLSPDLDDPADLCS
jgi:CRISPR-associated endonuclease/helicase Cas3